MTKADIAAICVAIVSLLFSIFTYWRALNRERKLDTMRELSKIREKYPDMSRTVITDGIRKQYLKDMEFFCIGVNNGLYDITIVNKMSGGMLVKQYRDYMKDFMEGRPDLSDGSRPYGEYKKVMEALETSRRK